jgi:hypothetical protein
MALFVSQRDDRGDAQGNGDQARAQQSSHDTLLLGIRIPQAEGEEEGSPATHPLSISL